MADQPPTPPTGLLKASRDRWKAFWASQSGQAVDCSSDLPRLVRWAQATDEYDRVAKVVKGARLVKGSMGQPVLNPLVAYLAHLEAVIAKAEADFGMTPMARLRLKVDKPVAQEDQVDEIRARRQARRTGAAG
jgi:P27 family predicted phage terminase small subunit